MARENIEPFDVNKLLKTFQWSICMKIFLGYWLANIYDTIWDKTVYGRLLSEQPSQKHMHFIQNVNISFSNHWAFTQCNAFNNDLKIPPLNDNFNQASYIFHKPAGISFQWFLFQPIPDICHYHTTGGGVLFSSWCTF